jgi:hypothetical protein
VSEWISIDNELPKNDKLVLILVNREDATVGQRDPAYSGCWRIGNDAIAWDYDFSFGVEMDVTHWMPLPEPLEEQEK